MRLDEQAVYEVLSSIEDPEKRRDIVSLDCDIYGPSAQIMLGVDEPVRMNDRNYIEPVIAHGMKLMSLGFITGENAPVIWRGPMASGAITQFVSEVEWGALDFLILDLPPGTGDIQLTLVQTIPLTGAVVVTTPQPVALAGAAS